MKNCLTLADFERYARNEMNGAERGQVSDHLAACRRCQAALQDFLDGDRFVERLRDDALAADDSMPASELPPGICDALFSLQLLKSKRDRTASPPPERLPVIEGFDIRRPIGQGGMGIVYEALQKKLNRLVALKLLPAVVGSAHPQLVARFRREAAAAARLHHANIIPIYDYGESPDGYYYAMELIDGISLATAIRRFGRLQVPLASTAALASVFAASDAAEGVAPEPLPNIRPAGEGSSIGGKNRFYYRQVAQWMAEAADALEYAHRHGLVHRDIKPSNLMLARDGRILILDFGLVKTADEHSVTASGALLGTYRYMSPEQVGAKRTAVDHRTDVYSLGATMYELLTFQPAFGESTETQVLSHILFREPLAPRKIAATVPLDLQTICLKALEKSPDTRYQSAQAMADDLRRYLSDAPIAARRPGLARRATKFAMRHPAITIAALAVAVVVCLAFAAFMHQRQQTMRAEIRRLSASAGALRDREDFKGAEEAYRQILVLNPDDCHGLISLASVYCDQFSIAPTPELFENADGLLSRAIELASNSQDTCYAWNARGVLLQLAQRLPAATEAFQHAIAANDGYYASWVGLGTVYALDHRASDAEVALEKAAALAKQDRARTPPEHWNTLLRWHLMPLQRLAAVQIHLKRPAAAQTVQQSLSLAEHTNAPTLLLAALYHLDRGAAGDADAALDYAQTAVSLASNNKTIRPEGPETLRRARRTLALAKLSAGQWAEAVQIAQQAEVAGDAPVYARLIAALAAAELGDRRGAQQLLEAAESVWPEDLKECEYLAIDDGASLWIDSRAELERLRTATWQLIEPGEGR